LCWPTLAEIHTKIKSNHKKNKTDQTTVMS